MADQSWQFGFAVGVQSALGTPNATIAGLTGALDSTDGIVLGDRESGEHESGITFPTFERVERAVADVPGSFTKQSGNFERLDTTGLAISIAAKGNGVAATPAVGEAVPFAGIDALWQMSGLIGANGGSNAEYDYTPRVAATSPRTRYCTIKIWEGDQSRVLQDCICSSTAFSQTPGGTPIVTFNIAVGSHDPATQFATGVTLPTFDYGEQLSLSAPIVRAVGHAFGSTRDWEGDLQVTITPEVSDVARSNLPTGIGKKQDSLAFDVTGNLLIDDGDTDFDWLNLTATSAPTADMTYQVGTAATGASDIINAYGITVANLQLSQYKATKVGDAIAVTFTGQARGTTAGGEFILQFN